MRQEYWRPKWDHFEEFVERDGEKVTFANRLRQGATFRERCWPVLHPSPRKRVKVRFPLNPFRTQIASDAIAHNARLLEAYRRLPCNPLFAHVMRVEDAMMERQKRRPR